MVNSKKLVVYYSYTGHTKMIAKRIEEKLGCDILEIKPIIPYGSPVWWYTIAPVIRTFLKQNDLSGKTIKPFATNAGWLGQTFKEIKKLCPNSNVKEGMNIVFTEDYNKNELVTPIDEIDNWILD